MIIGEKAHSAHWYMLNARIERLENELKYCDWV